ncbi:MAG TPA: dihydrodipicolinate synthase family protein [Chloroflexota bacterium]
MSALERAPRFPACIMATAVVPWTEHYALDEGLFRDEIRTLLAAEYAQLYIFGTAGEGYAVDDVLFERIARVFADEMRAAQAQPMVGVISLSLETSMRRIAFARDTLGVGLFQISLPGWGALEAGEVRSFFDTILGRFDDCQFLHYNLTRTGRLVTADEYAAIAADHPNLVATKNSTDSMQRVRDLLQRAPMLCHFLNERGFVYGSLIGECGLLISLATLNFNMGRHYFEAGRRRDVATLVKLEGELHEIGRAFQTCVGGGVNRIDGAYDKVLWRLHDGRFPLRLLPPYAGVESDVVDRFAALLRSTYPDWAPQQA